ncbi:hypothetical protein [Flavobacterium sp.]|jgi:hypothetical protein|uniref:hypothetical protein n=1 Tax=Flavobacterium sp. TaxID=239 RepID=UPI0037BF52F4
MKNVLKLMAVVAVFITYTSCENDATNATQLTSNDAIVNSKIDLASDDIATIADQLFDDINSNTITYRTIDNNLSIFSNCATITRTPAFGTLITPGTQVTKTIDFGTTGCTLNNGNIVRGKIIISFVFQPTAVSHTVTYTFDNFYHNNINFEGTKTFTRSMTAQTATSAPHPRVVMELEMTITMPNGDEYVRVGSRTRELVEGFMTPAFIDNIYRITGNWTTTAPNGNQHTATITEPIMAKMSCIAVNKPILAKGIITFTRNNITSTLNYGNGECDNIAVFTVNGISYTITIGN